MTHALRRRLTDAVLAGVVGIVMAAIGAYVGVSRAQAVDTTRITALESQVAQDRANQTQATKETEDRIRKDLSEIKTDLREVRSGQLELLQRLALRNGGN